MGFGQWLYFHIVTVVFIATVVSYEEQINDGAVDDVASLINRFKRMEATLLQLQKKSDTCTCNQTKNRNNLHYKSKIKSNNYSWGRPTSYHPRFRSPGQSRGYAGHSTRFPWKYLPDTICFRDRCKSTKDCCKRWNICDKSAKRCRDCWYGQECKSEADCCAGYPYCARVWAKDRYGRKTVVSGSCKRKL